MNINAPPDVLSVLEDGVDRKMRPGSMRVRVHRVQGLGIRVEALGLGSG